MKILKNVLMMGSIAGAWLMVGSAMAGEVTWWTPNWGEARARDLVAKFEAGHPDIKVNLEITTSDGLPQRILTALQSGAAPDMIEVQHAWVTGYAANNLILPVDDVITNREDYIPAALDYVTSGGKLWAIPYRIETLAVIYNKTHFKEAGLDPENPPKTWEEFAAAAKALTRDGRSGFAITGGGEVGNTMNRTLPFMWEAGGGVISEDGTKVLVNSPETVAAVKYVTDFYKNGISPASTLENDGAANRKLFIAEKVSMYQAGQFDLKPIKEQNPNIDVGVMINPAPAGKDTVGTLGGWSYILPAQGKNPTDAKVLLGFLSEAENQAILTDTFPARISAMKAERFQDPTLAVYRDALPFARPIPIHRNWVQMQQAYFDAVQRILLGDEDVQTALDNAAAEIEALL